MKNSFYTPGHTASPVRHGHGTHPVDEQARNFTVDCLNKIHALLNAQKTKEGDDCRLQFAVAKYLLELGWGRNPLRAIQAAADELMTPEEQQKLQRFVQEYARATNINATEKQNSNSTPFQHRAVSGSTGTGRMAADSASEPENPAG